MDACLKASSHANLNEGEKNEKVHVLYIVAVHC